MRSDGSDRLASLLRRLGAVLGPGLTAILHAGSIESSTDDVVTDTWKIFDAASADQDNRVFLKVVTDASDVSRHLKT